MILKSRDIEIAENEPFRNDALNRKESGEVLTQFVLSANSSLVICLDAPWGQGKTTFLKMWEQDLKNHDFPTIYFNAWESDFSDDALVCLIGEISASIEELSKTGNESKAIEYLSKTKDIGVSLIKRSIPAAAKIATAGILDLDKLTEQSLGGLAETLAKEQLEKYETSKKSIKSFRETISKLAGSVTDPENPKPLIFIIDELDRCRPNYAIEILEKAKHLFNVDNIVFVLGADKEQLGSSIKAIYGEGLNVNGYLRRFMDFDYILPSPEKGVFVKSLFKKYGFNDYFQKKNSGSLKYEGEQCLKMFSELFGLYRLTLRDQEQCCSLLSVSIKTTPVDQNLFPLFLCFLIVLKIKDPEVYKKLVHDEMSVSELLSFFGERSGASDLLSTNYGTALEAYIMTCKSYRYEDEEIQKKYASITNSSTSSDEDKYRANRILDIVKEFNWNGGVGILGYLLKKIEIASRFES